MSSHFSFSITCFALAGWPWSQQPGVCLKPWSRVCTGHTHLVTPPSRGYEDVTVTYIRRSEIPSRIYAKYQYRQESEYENTWCIIHSNIWVQLQSYHQRWQYYKNITSLIGANAKIQRDVHMWIVQRRSRVYRRKTRETRRGAKRMGLWKVCWRSTLPLHLSGQQLGESTRSKLWDLDMRIQGSQNSPANGDANAK